MKGCVGLGRGPVPQTVERGQEPPEGVQLLEEGELLGVVRAVLHKVPDHVRVTPIVQPDD